MRNFAKTRFSKSNFTKSYFSNDKQNLENFSKWKNEKVDTSVLETLIEHSNLFHYQNKHFYLFSKSGFTKGCQEKAAEMGNVTLVSYVDMMG